MKSSEQDKAPVSLADIIEQSPERRKVVLDMSRVDPTALTLIETLDVADASGIKTEDFGAVMERGTLRTKAMLLFALAWVIMRRVEPDLTYKETCTFDLSVVGEVDPKEGERAIERAEIVTGVAKLAGITPEEAGQLSMAEVIAISERERQRQVVPARRARRRKAG